MTSGCRRPGPGAVRAGEACTRGGPARQAQHAHYAVPAAGGGPRAAHSRVASSQTGPRGGTRPASGSREAGWPACKQRSAHSTRSTHAVRRSSRSSCASLEMSRERRSSIAFSSAVSVSLVTAGEKHGETNPRCYWIGGSSERRSLVVHQTGQQPTREALHLITRTATSTATSFLKLPNTQKPPTHNSAIGQPTREALPPVPHRLLPRPSHLFPG